MSTLKSQLNSISLKFYVTTTTELQCSSSSNSRCLDSAILFDNRLHIFGLVSVWTRVLYPAEAEQIVVYRTTWQSVDVPGDTQEIPSGAVGGSQGRRSVHRVELTLTVR